MLRRPDLRPSPDAYGDPALSLDVLAWCGEAYADSAAHRNPIVSPVYGDYTKPFPPTLVQGGTRELLLSDFVRQYQAIQNGGAEAVLDLYEGMPHGFLGVLRGAPESQTALMRGAAFIRQHLL